MQRGVWLVSAGKSPASGIISGIKLTKIAGTSIEACYSVSLGRYLRTYSKRPVGEFTEEGMQDALFVVLR